MSLTFKQAKNKMATKTSSVLYFCYMLLHDFRFLHDLELIKLLMSYDPYLTFKFKMFTANTQKRAVFMHVNYNIINNICLEEKNRQRYTAD